MSAWFERFGFEEVGERLTIGAYPTDADDVAALARAGVERVYNLCEDCEYDGAGRGAVSRALAARGIEERRLPLVDYGGLEREQLDRAVREVVEWLEAGHAVYLHCRAGWQRSATVAAGVIAVREGLDAREALAELRRRKPTAEPLDHQKGDLLRWWRSR